MKRRPILAGLIAPLLLGGAVRAFAEAPVPVPVPEGFVFLTTSLDAVRAGLQQRSLRVVAIVGPMLSAEATRDPALPYPNRLVARLRDAWPEVKFRLDLLPIARAESAVFEQRLAAGLAQYKPALVLWGPGGSAAARGDDLASFHWQLSSAISAIRAAGADLILMTPLYAPAVARLVNLPPYRTAVLQEAQEAGVPVLDRYDLMRFWSENGILDLDSTNPPEQLSVARTVNDWIAELLAGEILRAVR